MRFCADFLMEPKIFTGIMSGGMNFSIEMLPFLPPPSLTLIMTSPLVTENYKEPVNGEYEDATKRILKAMEVTADETDGDDNMENVEEMDNSYVICD